MPRDGVEYTVKVGDSILGKRGAPTFCSLRYDFKPASLNRASGAIEEQGNGGAGRVSDRCKSVWPFPCSTHGAHPQLHSLHVPAGPHHAAQQHGGPRRAVFREEGVVQGRAGLRGRV